MCFLVSTSRVGISLKVSSTVARLPNNECHSISAPFGALGGALHPLCNHAMPLQLVLRVCHTSKKCCKLYLLPEGSEKATPRPVGVSENERENLEAPSSEAEGETGVTTTRGVLFWPHT